jgi:hypothetical protein
MSRQHRKSSNGSGDSLLDNFETFFQTSEDKGSKCSRTPEDLCFIDSDSMFVF